MKKISIITILDNLNFGTYLQAFALCKVTESFGYKPELVAYCRPGHSVSDQYNKSLQSTRNPLKILARTYYAIRNLQLRKKDLSIIKNYLTSKKYYSYDDLLKDPPIADIYMTGSDQVWNSIYNRGIDKSFFLGYAPHNATLISYGSSIGMAEIPTHEKQLMYNLLSRYKQISVREHSSIKMLTDIGIPENKINHVLDPTLLMDKQQWKKFVKKRIHDFPYLLVYSVENKEHNQLVSEVAKIIAQKYNLKIVGVYYGSKSTRIDSCDINHYRATPSMFLSLMYYADFAVVSSFHGTAFAINFEKNFLTISPKMFNSRVIDILHICKLENRIIYNIDNVSPTLPAINYSDVNRILEEKRDKSIYYLKKDLI